MSITIIGMDKVKKALDQAAAQVRKESAVEINATARAVRDLARQMAPVLTGALRKSVQVKKRAHARRLGATVGSDMPYMRAVEFGTHTRGKAQPFLYPAAEALVPEFRKRMMEAAKRGLRPKSMDVGFDRAQSILAGGEA